MPTQPAIEGLPLWAQILISVIIGIGTLGIAFKGYLTKEKPAVSPSDPQSAAIMAATIADMGAIRNLSDCVVRLDASVNNLTRTLEESTHFKRNNIEVSNELCARLRELREELERHRGLHHGR